MASFAFLTCLFLAGTQQAYSRKSIGKLSSKRLMHRLRPRANCCCCTSMTKTACGAIGWKAGRFNRPKLRKCDSKRTLCQSRFTLVAIPRSLRLSKSALSHGCDCDAAGPSIDTHGQSSGSRSLRRDADAKRLQSTCVRWHDGRRRATACGGCTPQPSYAATSVFVPSISAGFATSPHRTGRWQPLCQVYTRTAPSPQPKFATPAGTDLELAMDGLLCGDGGRKRSLGRRQSGVWCGASGTALSVLAIRWRWNVFLKIQSLTRLF
jgi:hypothetical protein